MRLDEREKIETMYAEYNHKCFMCNRPANQRSHIIGNTMANRKRYGHEVIDSPLNWLPACGIYHNGLMDVGHASNLPDKIAELIRRGHKGTIEHLVELNIDRKLNKV